METIKSLDEIINAAQDRKLYIRWSRGPALDRKQGCSVDQVTHSRHAGLSVQPVRADNPKLLATMLIEYGFLRNKDARIYCWILAGEVNGTDSDNAPTIDASTLEPVGKVSDTLLAACSAFDTAYWQYQRKWWDSELENTADALFAELMNVR